MASGPIGFLTDALHDLDQTIEFCEGMSASTHTVVTVNGLDNPTAPAALGRYLVGALAGAVDLDARLSEALLAQGADRREEIRRTVKSLVGESNVFTADEQIRFRDTRRNAWIGEGAGHVLLFLSAAKKTSCVDGKICTLTGIHPTATRQGLDSVSTYVQSDLLGVAIGESKTTRSDPAGNLGEAVSLFTKIEAGEYQQDLRQELIAFRRALPQGLQVQVKDSIWNDNATYLPMIMHEDYYNFMNSRPTLGKLSQPLERRRVIVMQLAGFHGFFDSVADAMRAAVDQVVI